MMSSQCTGERKSLRQERRRTVRRNDQGRMMTEKVRGLEG